MLVWISASKKTYLWVAAEQVVRMCQSWSQNELIPLRQVRCVIFVNRQTLNIYWVAMRWARCQHLPRRNRFLTQETCFREYRLVALIMSSIASCFSRSRTVSSDDVMASSSRNFQNSLNPIACKMPVSKEKGLEFTLELSSSPLLSPSVLRAASLVCSTLRSSAVGLVSRSSCRKSLISLRSPLCIMSPIRLSRRGPRISCVRLMSNRGAHLEHQITVNPEAIARFEAKPGIKASSLLFFHDARVRDTVGFENFKTSADSVTLTGGVVCDWTS